MTTSNATLGCSFDAIASYSCAPLRRFSEILQRIRKCAYSYCHKDQIPILAEKTHRNGTARREIKKYRTRGEAGSKVIPQPHKVLKYRYSLAVPYCIHRVSRISLGFLGFTEFYWVLLGFTEFYWVLLGFTGFYWVLLGFTGFYWVLLGFTGEIEVH